MTTYLVVWALILQGSGALHFRNQADCQQYSRTVDAAYVVEGCHRTGPVTLREFTGVPGPTSTQPGDPSGQSASG